MLASFWSRAGDIGGEIPQKIASVSDERFFIASHTANVVVAGMDWNLLWMKLL